MNSIFSILLVFPLVLGAGTAGAAKLKPIQRKGVEYSTVRDRIVKDCPDQKSGCGDRTFLLAKEKATGRELWKTELYQVVHDDKTVAVPRLLQFVGSKSVALVDGQGAKYVVDLKTGKRTQPKEVKVYSGP